MTLTYNSYWRKSGLKGKWGKIFLEQLAIHRPRNFLEIGVFCGVTAKNTCSFLNKIHQGNFKYIGIDLFGSEKTQKDEVEPNFLKKQKFSNPLKNIYYNYILRENLNSIENVSKFLKEYQKNIELIKGDTNNILDKISISDIDFVFLDGGHSYQTVTKDLSILLKNLKGKKKVILCDDYGSQSFIPEVKKAVDDFVKNNNLKIEFIEDRFAKIIT